MNISMFRGIARVQISEEELVFVSAWMVMRYTTGQVIPLRWTVYRVLNTAKP
jgi:hypothetical protein